MVLSRNGCNMSSIIFYLVKGFPPYAIGGPIPALPYRSKTLAKNFEHLPDHWHDRRDETGACGLGIRRIRGAGWAREPRQSVWERQVRTMIVGFGNCHGRLQVARFLRERGFLLATAVHPRATVAADVSIGAGSVIVAGSVINPAAAIGENVIINTGSSVDHECIIGGRGTHRAGGAFGGVCHRRARFVGRYRFGGKGRLSAAM